MLLKRVVKAFIKSKIPMKKKTMISGGYFMEKILVKTGIYSFIVPFFLFVVFKKREEITTEGEGFTSSVITPYPEFFFNIFRYSVITSLIAVTIALVYLISEKKNG